MFKINHLLLKVSLYSFFHYGKENVNLGNVALHHHVAPFLTSFM